MNRNSKKLDMSVFKDNLRKISKCATDKEIAERLHYDTSTFSKKINNHASITLDELWNISQEFDCSIDDLVGLNEVNNTSYDTLFDFISRLLPICENEEHIITEIDNTDLDSTEKVYALSFKNTEINNILSEMKTLEDMKSKQRSSRIYNAWKKEIVQTSKERLKRIDYEDTNYYLAMLMCELNDMLDEIKKTQKCSNSLSKTDEYIIENYGNGTVKELYAQYNGWVINEEENLLSIFNDDVLDIPTEKDIK